MKKRKISLFLVVVILFTLILTSCSNDQEGGFFYDENIEEDYENKKEEEKEEDDDTVLKQNIKFDDGESIYLSQLDDRTREAFYEIRDAAVEGEDIVYLENIITEKDFKRILNIILLDSPEVIGVSNNFSYKKDSSGNVSEVHLKYLLTKENLEELKEAREEHILEVQNPFLDENTSKRDAFNAILNREDFTFYSNKLTQESVRDALEGDREFDENEKSTPFYDRESLAKLYAMHINEINGEPVKGVQKIKKIDGIDYDGTFALVNSPYFGLESMPITSLQVIVDNLRMVGINASIVGGEFISYELLPKKSAIDPYKFLDHNSLLKKVEREDGLIDISLNPYNYYFWIVYETGDSYYHLDLEIANLINEYIDTSVNGFDEDYNYNRVNVSSKYIPRDVFFSLPDSMISGTRIMYHNEDLLGLVPACSNHDESSLNEHSFFVNSSNLMDIKKAAESLIDEMIKGENTVRYRFFKNSKDLKSFTQFFDETIDKANKENQNIIKDYRVKSIPLLNLFIVLETTK